MTNTATMTANTVREIAQQVPGAAPIFEKHGIDYCCNGHRPLAEVCAEKGLTVEAIFAEIESRRELEQARAARPDMSQDSLRAVVTRICETHHLYVRNEIPRIENLLSKVPDKHGPNHPELYRVREIFTALAAELSMHLMKEEQILFPFITALEESKATGESVPTSCFGSIENPIRMMHVEHDSASGAVTELRAITGGYQPPEDACNGFRNLYKALEEFEADLLAHIAIENNVLFVRATALANA